MHIQVVVGGVDHAPGDIGAVVRGTLQIRQQVGPDKACLDAALALLHPQDMSGTQLLLQIVDDLLQRLHLPGSGHILLPEGVQRPHEDIVDRGGQHAQLPLRLVAEGQPLLPQLLRRLQHVHRMVGDTLKIADGLQQLCGLLALLLTQLLGAELYQIGAQHVLVMVNSVLFAQDFIRNGVVPDAGGGSGSHPPGWRRPALRCSGQSSAGRFAAPARQPPPSRR